MVLGGRRRSVAGQGDGRRTVVCRRDALEVVLGDLGGGLEVEGFPGDAVSEEDLLDGCLAAPAREVVVDQRTVTL